MTEQQPITPPPELVQEWIDLPLSIQEILVIAAQWGWKQRDADLEAKLQKARDEELNACEEWLREARNHGFGYDHGKILSDKLRAARRPKPKSLAEEALEALNEVVTDQENTISRALKRLQELEGQQ